MKTNTSLIKYIEKKISPFKLNESYKSKINILTNKYNLEDLKNAVDISFNSYISYDFNNVIEKDSINLFLDKIGGIAHNNSLPPIDKEIVFIKNKCRLNFSFWDDTVASNLLKEYVSALREINWSDEKIINDLKNELMIRSMKCKNWSDWKNLVEVWIDSINNKICKSKLLIQKGNSISFSKKYYIYDEIGFGSSGITYLCFEKRLKKLFVIKDFSSERISSLENQSFFDKFVKEIDCLFELHHQNIVSIYDYYIDYDNKKAFYIMEYVDGGNIEEYLINNPEKCNNLFEQAINTFYYLEKKKICHRDIRTHNLLVTKDGQLKIIDFGFLKNIEKSNSVNTTTKLIVYPYNIPEELNNVTPKYDNKTDLYFIGKLFEELIAKLTIKTFKYSNILNKMIAYKYSERYSSFESVLKELKKYI